MAVGLTTSWTYNNWSDKDFYQYPVFNFIQGDDYYVYPGKGIEDFELLRIIDSPRKEEAIGLAARNWDGRKKNLRDFEEVRRILLDK